MAPKKQADEIRRTVLYQYKGSDVDAELYLFGLDGESFPTKARLRFLRQGQAEPRWQDLDDPHDLVEIRDMLNEAIQEFGL